MDAITEVDVAATAVAERIQPVILCGGIGTGLWPLSRRSLPKQLLSLTSERSLLQETVARTPEGSGFAAPLIVCNREHLSLVAAQIAAMGVEPRMIIAEPARRDTAPALAVAALVLIATEPDAMLLVEPADHRIADGAAFRAAINRGAAAAAMDRLVMFATAAHRPETAFGYIRRGASLDGADGVFEVSRFVEAPDRETAARYVGTGDYLWNSSIYLVSARRYLEELEAFEPKLLLRCADAVAAAARDGGVLTLEPRTFEAAAEISIDRAVMTRTGSAAVVVLDTALNDIGSWRTLVQGNARDGDGNVVIGDAILQNVRDCYIRAEEGLVAAVGLKDVVVVSTGDAVLVASAEDAPDVGKLVGRLRGDPRCEAFRRECIHRPWGQFKIVDGGSRHQVKELVVKPGQRLSLQLHHHRSEHWVVVSGTARVVCGDDARLLRESESIHIPAGAQHRLENPGRIPLCVIEVQCGAYLGEDDIVRIDDIYGRS